MRDIPLLGFTLLAMRDLGEGRARLVREDRNHQEWFAGGQPLNAQAVQDLIADGWLRRDGDQCDVRMDAWPGSQGRWRFNAMADYFTNFSCLFDVGSVENVARAKELHRRLVADLDHEEGTSPGFEMQADPESGPAVLWIYSDDCGDPDCVIQFVLLCAEAFDLQGVWAFTWALTCSKPRLDAFGGGAHVIDLGKRATIADLDCAAWVSRYVDPHDKGAIEQSEALL